MEFGSLERVIHIDASPEIVFEVVSRSEHVRRWWPDDASFDSTPGATGEVVWGDRDKVEKIVIVEVDPPRTFSFRWIAAQSELPVESNSLLVTFDLTRADDGTTLRMRESGWREKGWDAAQLEEVFRDHERGWELFLGRLQDYAQGVVVR
jgi:uncharacterized protein YndB with AHSA1/START domain